MTRALLLALLLTACATPPQTEAELNAEAVRAFHAAACADPRGTLADGTCRVPMPKPEMKR